MEGVAIVPPLPSGVSLNVCLQPPAESASEVCLGGMIWPAAPVLCRWMTRSTATIQGAAVLELGAGTGVCGLYAAGLGASVCLTEGGPDAPRLLELMRRSVAANVEVLGEASSCMLQRLDWGCTTEELPIGPFDLVLGSDIVWGSDDENHEALCATIGAILRRDAGRRPRAILAVQHGLPIAPPGPALASHVDGALLDETIEQLCAAAARHNLRIRSLATEPPVPVPVPVDTTADASATYGFAGQLANGVDDQCGGLLWHAASFDRADVCVLDIYLTPEDDGGARCSG